MDIKKFGAAGILAAMMLGVFSVAGSTIIDHAKSITVLETKEERFAKDIDEIKTDIKAIKTLLQRR